jgi:DNA-binding XRE family transcriptional regulator
MARKTELYDRLWLEKARARTGMTQEAVATACGISTGHYNKIEQGLQTPSVKIGVTIADVLGFDIHLFVREKKYA